MMAAGFLGAAVLLVAANVLGFVGGGQSDAGTVKGAYASFKASGLTPQQIYEKHAGSVVEITATFPGTYDMFGQQTGGGQALGTGFVVSEDGYILTNAHVVSESGQAVSTVTVTFKGDGTQGAQVEGTVLGADESTDVALIKVDPSQAPALRAIPLGDSSAVTVGEEVVAIGNPLGLDFSLSTGVVSATDRELQSPNGATITGGIQTDAAINHGNSGGPLINAKGEVIGINEQIASQGGGSEGIGFAVPINTAVQVMEQIKAGTLSQPAQTADPYGIGSEMSPY
jgi:2-alkenal reductase